MQLNYLLTVRAPNFQMREKQIESVRQVMIINHAIDLNDVAVV